MFKDDVQHMLGLVGLNLQAYRKKANLSQEALADLSGVSRSNIANIERGSSSPSIATMLYLARALDIEVGDFFKEQKQGQRD